ncbi:MAG TPA: hypothetical protein VF301_00595 [Ginsengibacter sp.]
MKNDETRPAYNILAGSENQFIVSYSVHQNTNDAPCFKGHVEQPGEHTVVSPKAIIADSIFGTEENYEIIEQKKIGNYLKYPTFHIAVMFVQAVIWINFLKIFCKKER